MTNLFFFPIFISFFCFLLLLWWGPSLKPWELPCSSYREESACNVGDLGSIPGSGRSFVEGNGNPLQYSCLENPMDKGAWWATSPWSHKESDMTEWLSTAHIFKILIECVTILLLSFVLVFGCKACEILALQPGIKPVPPTLEEVLTTGPPEKSLSDQFLILYVYHFTSDPWPVASM